MSGRLVTIVGVMGSGKTEKLIEMFKDFLNEGKKVMVFKPTKDTRTSKTVVKSRSGATAPATSIREIEDIYDYDGDFQQAVLIDEIQFFDQPDVINSLLALTLLGIDVYCFGLDLTSDGTTFGQVGDIMAHSDEVIKLEMKCTRCDNLARISSYNGDDKDGDVKVGDLDVYEPICRSCFYEDEISVDIEDSDPLYLIEIGNVEMGFTMELLVKQSSLEKAGYTYAEVLEINTVEGANNLLQDLGMFEEEGEE